MDNKPLPSNPANFLLYATADGKLKVEVFIKAETVWLTQEVMAELFGVKIPAISKHLANIYETGELQKEALFPFWKQFKRKDKGRVSMLETKLKTEKEYEKYRIIQDKN